jgi:ferredoxin
MGEPITVTLPSGARFSAERGENLLSAAQRAHWLVRYGCRNGNCEACAATLLQGRVQQRGVVIDSATEPQAILLCLCSAETDLHIELPDNPLHGSAEQARRCYAQLVSVEQTAPQQWRLQFTLPAGRQPPVYAGQFLLIESAQDLLRAEIDTTISQGRQLHAYSSAQPPLANGEYAYIRYPLGYCYWRVQRQDDNGNCFEVAAGLSETAARALADELTGRGHKQLYWIEPM